MKILIVTHYFAPHIGGIENVAHNQARELIEKGHEVTIVTSKTVNEKEIVYFNGIKVIRVRAINILENIFGIPYPIFSPKILKILNREVRCSDVVHLHGHVYMSSVIASFLSKKNHKVSVVTQHNTFVEYSNILLRVLQSVADRTIGRYVLNNATQIIAVSNKTKGYVESIIGIGNKTVVHYNGIDLQRFEKKTSTFVSKKILGVKSKFVCLTVRRITFKNGIDTILHTAEMLLKNKDILFLIGGTGPDLEKVRDYIKKNNLVNIKLLGFISNQDLPLYYSLSDVFILPSKKGEGFPLVVLEAFASGIPVIATKSGGHEEIIKNGENGYLVEINSHNQIFNKIMLLYKHQELLKTMKGYCAKQAKNNFSWVENSKKLNSIYKEVSAYGFKG